MSTSHRRKKRREREKLREVGDGESSRQILREAREHKAIKVVPKFPTVQ